MSSLDVTDVRAARPFLFEGLPSYTRGEVALSNWGARFLRDSAAWKAWIQDAWGDLLLAPAGLELTLHQTGSVEPQAQPRTYSFRQNEVLIGRDPGSDVVLETLAAGKRHARLVVERSRCFLEDLGSSLGTYCNQVRVTANERRALEIGDEISVFPYVFVLGIRQLWTRQSNIGVYAGQPESISWQAFRDSAARGRSNFAVRLHPTQAWIWLEVSRAFLADLADRILRPLGIDGPSSGGGAADQALFEFLMLCLVERANRDLEFPCQLEIVPGAPPNHLRPSDSGISIALSITLLASTGALRLFMPYASLEALSAVFSAPAPAPAPAIDWRFPVSLGTVDLTSGQLAGLERRDILIPTRRLELLLPHRFDRGWSARELEVSSGARNFTRLQIDKYFERGPVNHPDDPAGNAPEPNASPDLQQLPVRIHVIVGEKELTFAEAACLGSGSILELDRDPAAPVSLAVNGKVLGEGQLVDIEGRLGVRILSWRGA